MRLLPLACVVLAACPPPPTTSDSGPGPDDSGTMDAGRDGGRPPPRDAGVDAGWVSVPEDQWCHAQATARCWRDLRCGRIDSTLLDDCIERTGYACDSSAYVRSGREGRHRYDAAQAAKCLDAYDQGSCTVTPSQCGSVFTGLTEGGRGALVPEDCDPDSGFYYLYENTCPHHCIPWARAGQPCFDSLGRYQPSCQPGVHGCEFSPDAGDEICMPPHLENEACSSPYSCAPQFTCSGNKCVKLTAATGEPCRVTGYLPSCGLDDFCRIDPATPMGPGTCQRRMGLGGVCSGADSCLEPLRCSSIIGTGTCQRRLGVGEPCSDNFSGQCADGLSCPNSTSRCAPLPGDGGDCSFEAVGFTPYHRCALGYACSEYPSYICIPRKADGQPCNGYDEVCLSNECQYGMFPDAGYGYRCVRCSQMADGG